MINYKQVLTEVNTEYTYSVDIGSLNAALAQLDAVLAAPNLNESNRANAEALRMRLVCKIYTLEYLQKYEQAVAERISAFVAENAPIAAEKGYKKSAAVLSGTDDFVRGVQKFLSAKDEISALSRSESVLLASGTQLVDSAQRLIDDAAALTLTSPFGDGVAFPDIRERLTASLDSWKAGICGAYIRSLEHSVPCKKLDYSHYDYFPVPEYDEGGKANALILNTPFLDEARLFAAHALPKNVELREFDVNAAGDSEGGIARIFAYLGYKNCAGFITRAEVLSDKNRKALLCQAMRFGKSGGQVFIVDTDGGTLYDTALVCAAEDEGLSALDISTSYITMPLFDDVCKELKLLKLATDADCEDKLRDMPFLGFMGLNEITKPENLKIWHTRGKKISAANAATAKKYLARLRAAMLFIDDGWGSFKSGLTVTDEIGEFDYDDIKDIDIGNIKKIVTSGATIFGKCGMIARYCTTGTADVSVWNGMGREEMLERLTLAVKLVYRILMVPINPEVCLSDELSNKGAGGLCCDGGKKIVFKYECCQNDATWTRGCIVHECFHALQAKLRDGNWSKWYYDNMGITRGRACRWQITNRIYDDNVNSNVYKVHMVEGDAKAFEVDCQDGLDEFWSTIDFD